MSNLSTVEVTTTNADKPNKRPLLNNRSRSLKHIHSSDSRAHIQLPASSSSYFIRVSSNDDDEFDNLDDDDEDGDVTPIVKSPRKFVRDGDKSLNNQLYNSTIREWHVYVCVLFV